MQFFNICTQIIDHGFIITQYWTSVLDPCGLRTGVLHLAKICMEDYHSVAHRKGTRHSRIFGICKEVKGRNGIDEE